MIHFTLNIRINSDNVNFNVCGYQRVEAIIGSN